MNFPQPPEVNGILELTEEQTLSIQEKLVTIQNEFQPSYDQPVCDTFYLVVTYTQKHEKDADFIRINGDTAQHVLSFSTETTPDTTSEGTTSDNTETGEV
jgi:hypothetical protein